MGVFSELKPKNTARRNPFDTSARLAYNTKVGHILPLKFFPTLPSSEYEVDIKSLLRTQPLLNAAFAGFSINYDVVWTPNNDHYSSFNQFIAQRLNKQHTTQPDISSIPSFKPSYFFRDIFGICLSDMFLQEVTLQELVVLHDNQDYDITVPVRPLIYSEQMPNESMCLNCLRTLDLLEYGNYLPIVKGFAAGVKEYLDNDCVYTNADNASLPHYIRFLAMTDSDVFDPSTNTFSDLYGWVFKKTVHDVSGWFLYYFVDNRSKIQDYLYMNSTDIFHQNYEDFWSILCYNKVFWQFYRNEYYDIDFTFYLKEDTAGINYQRHSIEYVKLFNMDDINGKVDFQGSFELDDDNIIRVLCMFAVKPHQYKKDLFTGLLPSTQYGDVSVASSMDIYAKLIGNSVSYPSVPTSPSSSKQILLNKSNSSQTSEYLATGYAANSVSTFPFIQSDKFKFDPSPMISVLELRRADSLQRFKERMLRAGNKTKDIFRAHGWDEPKSEAAFEAQFLGNYDGRLDLNVVASTTETPNISLGQLAANGVSVIKGSKIRFKSHDFGVLLVVAYITKDAFYDAYGVNKAHSLLEPFDFPYPELQNVSLSPIVESQVYQYKSGANTKVLGYLPQNMVYKTQSDLVHGEFFTVCPFEPGIKKSLVQSGIFANMVTPRLDVKNASALSFFYIQPDCADNIFVVNANSLQSSDQFFGTVNIDVKAVQPLDVIGLPI